MFLRGRGMFLHLYSTWHLILNFGAINDYPHVFEASEIARQVSLNLRKCGKACHGFRAACMYRTHLENVLLQCDIVTPKLRGSSLIKSPIRRCASTIENSSACSASARALCWGMAYRLQGLCVGPQTLRTTVNHCNTGIRSAHE